MDIYIVRQPQEGWLKAQKKTLNSVGGCFAFLTMYSYLQGCAPQINRWNLCVFIHWFDRNAVSTYNMPDTLALGMQGWKKQASLPPWSLHTRGETHQTNHCTSKLFSLLWTKYKKKNFFDFFKYSVSSINENLCSPGGSKGLLEELCWEAKGLFLRWGREDCNTILFTFGDLSAELKTNVSRTPGWLSS